RPSLEESHFGSPPAPVRVSAPAPDCVQCGRRSSAGEVIMRVKNLLFLQSAVAHVPTVLVLAFLAAVGYWGAAPAWAGPHVSALFSHPEEAEKEPAIVVTPDPAAQQSGDPCTRQFQNVQIRFPSADAARKAGLKWTPVEWRPMARYITANGSIDYDQNRVAHL